LDVIYLPHPNPSPKERDLKTTKYTKRSVKVLSFGEDLGEAKQNAYTEFAFNKYIYCFKRQRYE